MNRAGRTIQHIELVVAHKGDMSLKMAIRVHLERRCAVAAGGAWNGAKIAACAWQGKASLERQAQGHRQQPQPAAISELCTLPAGPAWTAWFSLHFHAFLPCGRARPFARHRIDRAGHVLVNGGVGMDRPLNRLINKLPVWQQRVGLLPIGTIDRALACAVVWRSE